MIFLDNASTTKMYDEAFEVLKKYCLNNYFNPSALYAGGVNVHRDIENARKTVANIIGAESENIIFTASASEATNLAIMGSFQANFKHVVISEIEHPSMQNTIKNLQQKGIKVDYLKTNSDGRINIDSVKNTVTSSTNLISVMLVNNETGAINNVREIAKIAKSINPHIIVVCDCVQAFCKINFKVKQLGVDFAVFSSHKVHGPKGVGALYCKNLNKLKPQILGGGQERGFRSGTENTGGIIAFATACEIMYGKIQENFEYVSKLKSVVVNKLKTIQDVIINAEPESSPYVLNFSIKGIKAEVLLHMLEEFDIYVGNGSACSAKHQDNRILKSMGVNSDYIKGTIRVSFSEFNTIEEIEFFCDKLEFCINKLRNIINKQ